MFFWCWPTAAKKLPRLSDTATMARARCPSLARALQKIHAAIKCVFNRAPPLQSSIVLVLVLVLDIT